MCLLYGSDTHKMAVSTLGWVRREGLGRWSRRGWGGGRTRGGTLSWKQEMERGTEERDASVGKEEKDGSKAQEAHFAEQQGLKGTGVKRMIRKSQSSTKWLPHGVLSQALWCSTGKMVEKGKEGAQLNLPWRTPPPISWAKLFSAQYLSNKQCKP